MSALANSAQVSPNAQEAWAEIRKITFRFSQHARNREWKAVSELHALRERLIRSFFAKPVAVSEANEVREGILAVLESNKEIIALAREERSNAAAKIHKLQSGRKAGKVYADIGIGI